MIRKKLILDLYKKAYLIRSAEDLIIKRYDNNEMKTPMHMFRGEEAITVGVCSALGKLSQIFGTYRSHGLYLAVTEETDKFFAEVVLCIFYHRRTAYSEFPRLLAVP